MREGEMMGEGGRRNEKNEIAALPILISTAVFWYTVCPEGAPAPGGPLSMLLRPRPNFRFSLCWCTSSAV